MLVNYVNKTSISTTAAGTTGYPAQYQYRLYGTSQQDCADRVGIDVS
jgi:hypothetical protein